MSSKLIPALDFFNRPTPWEWPQGELAPWVALLTFDPHVERLGIQRLNFEGLEKNIILGSEVTVDWVDAHLVSLGFFASAEVAMVLAAENLKADVLARLKEIRPNATQGRALFCFSKEGKPFKELGALPEVLGINIQPPKFWEYQQVVSGLARLLGVNLPGPAATYLAEALPQDVGEIHQALQSLSLIAAAGQTLTLPMVQELFPPARLDVFKFASLYSKKDRKTFFLQLMKLAPSHEELEDFFRFMQGHLLKLADTDALKSRPKLSKYDKEILEASALWKRSEIAEEAHFFSRLQILAKEKSQALNFEMVTRLI